MAMFGRRSDKAEALADIPLFASVSGKDRMELARHLDEVAVQGGAVLTKQGAPGDAFYLIVEGKADVVRDGIRIALLGPGDAVGELALLDGQPRSATVTMITDGTVLTMPRREFRAVIDDIPTIAYKLLVALALRLRRADSRLTL